MKKHLVLVGGGHAHMVTLANLRQIIGKGHRVTVVGPSVYHYYSGMGPGMLGMTYTPEEIRFATKQAVEKQGGIFVLDKATRIDPKARTIMLESGTSIAYDIVSFNSGSVVPPVKGQADSENIFSVKPIERLLKAQKRIIALTDEKPAVISVIGGGPAAAEMAGNVWQLTQKKGKYKPTINIHAGKKFMPKLPENIRGLVSKSLTQRGIKILEEGYVKEVRHEAIVVESGEAYPSDFIFIATGVIPSPIFKDSNLPTGPDGGLKVNPYLQSVAYPELFGGGDCIYFQDRPLDKVGVYAVRQNPVLYHNLTAALEETSLSPFDPGGDYLLIFNLGNRTGIFRKRSLIFSGRLAFTIKDYIDRKFMRKFQLIE